MAKLVSSPRLIKPSCRFSAIGITLVGFLSRVMRPISPTWLSGMAMVDEVGNLGDDQASRTGHFLLHRRKPRHGSLWCSSLPFTPRPIETRRAQVFLCCCLVLENLIHD